MTSPARAQTRVQDPATDELQLVENLLAGRREGVSEFLTRSHHAVFFLACRLTTDPDLRRDWTHAALLGVVDDLAAGRFVYRRPGSFWAWFRKRVYFRLLEELRRYRTSLSRERPSGIAGEESFDRPGTSDPSMEMEQVEFLSALEGCLARIALHDQRRAVALRVVEDLSYEEIAASMSRPLNTVRSWIRRGRLELRNCLAVRLGLGGPEGDL